MKQTAIIAIILGVLLLVSAVQAYQLTTLKSKVAEGKLSVGSAPAGASSVGSGGAVPKSIQNLPSMVGGC